MKFFKPKKIIYRNSDVPLLIRWSLFECSWFAIKIHKLMTSDHACLHDHPWASLGFLISGGYVEYVPKHDYVSVIRDHEHGNQVIIEEKSRVRSRFSLIYRPANFTHRLEIHEPVWTLFITFKKVRQWGFFTKSGWVEFFKYEPKNQCE